MVKCLADYRVSNVNGEFSSYNLLLEYGEKDLDVYFAQTRPPLLKQEIGSFWKELRDVVNALEAIHNPLDTHDGRKYKGFV